MIFQTGDEIRRPSNKSEYASVIKHVLLPLFFQSTNKAAFVYHFTHNQKELPKNKTEICPSIFPTHFNVLIGKIFAYQRQIFIWRWGGGNQP